MIWFWFMLFNATFNNISVISWRSVLLVEETGGLWENHWPVASHWKTLSHNVGSKYTLPWTGFKLTTLVVIGTDCTGSCKFTTTTGLKELLNRTYQNFNETLTWDCIAYLVNYMYCQLKPNEIVVCQEL